MRGGRKAVRKGVKQGPGSHVRVTMLDSPTRKGRTIARCQMLRHLNCIALMRYMLRAKHARRVHIRVGRVKRALFGSRHCNKGRVLGKARFDGCGRFMGGYFRAYPHRTLRTVALNFIRPHANRRVFFASPLPRSVAGLVSG